MTRKYYFIYPDSKGGHSPYSYPFVYRTTEIINLAQKHAEECGYPVIVVEVLAEYDNKGKELGVKPEDKDD